MTQRWNPRKKKKKAVVTVNKFRALKTEDGDKEAEEIRSSKEAETPKYAKKWV